ncbi:hypothetical protein ACEN88_24250 [Massilia sp. CT11-108]|uniref:hypothetical protein n=1 Tax=Massilia sp. CT11-108 TaxID=3393900 RepID=UPI0039A7008D
MLNGFKSSFGQSLRIGIAPDALALVRTSIWPHERARLLGQVAATGADPVSLGAALGMLLGEHDVAGLPVTVVLADDLARLWQVTPPEGATRLADLEAAAMLRYQALFGGGVSGWSISADWDAARPFLAAAVPLSLLEQLTTAAISQRFRLVEIVPQFVAALNQHRRVRRAGAWFGVVHGGVLCICPFDRAQVPGRGV